MTIYEIELLLQLLEKEKNWILTLRTFYTEKPEQLEKVVGILHKEQLELIDKIIDKLRNIEVTLQKEN